jgi:hypothetical protein
VFIACFKGFIGAHVLSKIDQKFSMKPRAGKQKANLAVSCNVISKFNPTNQPTVDDVDDLEKTALV